MKLTDVKRAEMSGVTGVVTRTQKRLLSSDDAETRPSARPQPSVRSQTVRPEAGGLHETGAGEMF